MSKLAEYREKKRKEWLKIWETTLREARDAGADEEELVQLWTSVASQMHKEQVLSVRQFDTLHLLEAILIIRSYLRAEGERHAEDKASEENLAAELHDYQSVELLDFLTEVHRIVQSQEKLGDGSRYADEDKEIKQELYDLFDRHGYAREDRKQDRLQMMIRLVMLAVPKDDWKMRKSWAQREFVDRGIWSQKKQGAQWKELKGYWEETGDVWAEGEWGSVQEQMDDFWSLLETPLRGDRRKARKSENSPKADR
jgi:hypothetical protein